MPGILRSIYAYHTQSRGWSDVGYNFLVDKFGRIWEGRAGGIDRPVVGAHTLGYNDYAFAMSAIGNFETVQPKPAMLQAYGALMAWKLSLHGVDASSTKQVVGPDSFQAINGHRDAGSTACPGRNLYAKLSVIREHAAEAQRGWDGRELESDLAGTPHPDLIVRRASDGQAFILPTGGLTGFKPAQRTTGLWAGADSVIASPDLTGDGVGDLLVRSSAGVAHVRPGTGTGFGAAVKETTAFAERDLVTAVGDLNGDGRNDLVARHAENGRPNVYLGGGGGGFERSSIAGDWSSYDLLAATGDVDGDGNADLLARDAAGVLWRLPGTGTKSFGDAVKVSGGWARYDTIAGFGDFTRDGVGDLVVRVKGEAGYILPSRGDGTFGHQMGPVSRIRSGAAIGGANLVGDGTPDLVARRGDDLVMFANTGRFDIGPGHRDRGHGPRRQHAPQRRRLGPRRVRRLHHPHPEGRAQALPRRRQRRVLGPGAPRQGLRWRQAARGRRRHDGRRVARPDGSARHRVHAPLPGQGSRGAPSELRRAQPDRRRRPGPGRPLGHRRRAGHPDAQGRQAHASSRGTARGG